MIFVTDKPGDDPLVWKFLEKRTSLPWSTDLRIMGLARNDFTLIAAVGYNMWVGDSCFMHVAFDSPKSLTRDLLCEAFKYPFQYVNTVYGMTPITFQPALRFNKKLGFKEIFRTEQFVLQIMRKEECRWLRGFNRGKKQQLSSST